MKLISVAALLTSLFFFDSLSAQHKLVLQGVYKEQDVYVKNPFAAEGVGFCTYQVEVNGQVTSDEVNSSAFIIDLHQYAFKKGDPVEIILSHKENCLPEFINPKAIAPEPSFDLLSIDLNPNGMLSWRTIFESGSLPYVIEQFKWNKWIRIGEVIGTGHSGENDYGFQADLHFGENTLRIYQGADRADRKYSESVKVFSNRPAQVELLTERFRENIEFSGPTSFEIFDEFGNLRMRGNSKHVDISKLEKGTYYLNYSNVAGKEFQKK